MNEYTIYCTEEQTKKALELGAPIYTAPYFSVLIYEVRNFFVKDDTCYYFPTVEQTLGWLEEQNIAIDLHAYFKVNNSRINHYEYTVTDSTRVFNGSKITRKEATLAVIDAALDYLSNQK